MSPVPGDAKVPGSWLPASGEILASKRSDFTSLRGWQLTGPQHQAKPAASSCIPPVRAAKREPSRSHNAAKAMEGVWDLGAGAEEPSGVRGVERSEGCPGNWGDPPRPDPCGGSEQHRSISGRTVKWSVAERESEGVVVALMVRTTQPGWSEGPLLHSRTTVDGRSADECRKFG